MSQKGQYNNIIDNNINNKIDRLFNYIIDKENEVIANFYLTQTGYYILL